MLTTCAGQVPSLILLVLGSVSFEALFTAQTLSGVQDAFRMFVTAIALVYGIFVANMLLPAPSSRALDGWGDPATARRGNERPRRSTPSVGTNRRRAIIVPPE